jgi:hypothetical protein
MRTSAGALVVIAITLVLHTMPSGPAQAWGDEGHEVVALVAQAYLEPAVRKKVSALLAADTDPLTAHNIAAAATWADKFRDANQNGARQKTRQWHFVDIEITAPNLDQACFDHPPVPSGTPASNGPEQDCVVDKIQEFAAELANRPLTLRNRLSPSSSCSTLSVTSISRCMPRMTMIAVAMTNGFRRLGSAQATCTISGTPRLLIILAPTRTASPPT